MSKFIPKEINPFRPPEIPRVIPAPAAPRSPERPPEPTNLTRAKDDLEGRRGYKANLMTGGLGLKNINQANLVKKTLGNKLGLSQ